MRAEVCGLPDVDQVVDGGNPLGEITGTSVDHPSTRGGWQALPRGRSALWRFVATYRTFLTFRCPKDTITYR